MSSHRILIIDSDEVIKKCLGSKFPDDTVIIALKQAVRELHEKLESHSKSPGLLQHSLEIHNCEEAYVYPL